MKVIIIGGIASGMSAAAKLRRVNPEVEVTIYEKSEYVSFGACGLPYYVGNYFEDEKRMFVRTPEQVRNMGISLHLKHEVLKVDIEKKTIFVKNLETGEEFEDSYDNLMVATGAKAVVPPIKNITLEHIYFLRTLEDGYKVREKLADPQIKKVGIIGAGFIGLEVAEAAHKQGKEVAIFQLEDRVLPSVFDTEITDIIEEELTNKGIQLYLNAAVKEFEGLEKVTKVITAHEKVDVDLVIIATGVRPNTSFLEDTGIHMLKNGAIVVDQQGRTSIPGIFAAGDCATVPHLLMKDAYIPLATSANKLGRVVGENMGGGHTTYEGTLGSSCVKVLDLEAGRTGLTEREARNTGRSIKTVFITDKNHTDYYPGQEQIHVKLIYDGDTFEILGGQTVGKSDAVLRSNIIATAIQAKMTTKQLGMLDLCYSPPFARTWDVLNVAGNVAK